MYKQHVNISFNSTRTRDRFLWAFDSWPERTENHHVLLHKNDFLLLICSSSSVYRVEFVQLVYKIRFKGFFFFVEIFYQDKTVSSLDSSFGLNVL